MNDKYITLRIILSKKDIKIYQIYQNINKYDRKVNAQIKMRTDRFDRKSIIFDCTGYND